MSANRRVVRVSLNNGRRGPVGDRRHSHRAALTLRLCLLWLVTIMPPASAQTTRVSRTAAGPETTGGGSYRPAVSADGRFVAFQSAATNLVPGDTNGVYDIFLHDRATGTTTRVSVATGGAQAANESSEPAISADGRCVAFSSHAANLVAGDTNGVEDVFVHDRLTGTTTRVSIATGGIQGTASSTSPALGADCRFVAFTSLASNLVAGDANRASDVFVHDRATGATTRVSMATSGRDATGDSFLPDLSGDGRFVAFTSAATDLVPGDTNGRTDVFLHDRVTGVTTRVSVATGGGQASHDSSQAVMSQDGRYVAFTSLAGDLVRDDANRASDVFVHDRATGTTTRVSVATAGLEARGDSFLPDLSSDGRVVAFTSTATELVPGDTNGLADVFLHDRLEGTTVRVSTGNGGVQATGGISRSPALSADGRYVAFESDAPNLVLPDANNSTDVFVHDARMYQRRRISVSSGGEQGVSSSANPSLSADGRYVAFHSHAPNLVGGDTNGNYDVFVHDRATGATTRVSVATGGRQATGLSAAPSMSGDGRYVAFESSAPDLVPGDTNTVYDVFVHDRVTGETRRVSVDSLGTQAAQFSSESAMSADGRFVAFMSAAPNLVAGDTNTVYDVFVHDRVTGETTRVSVTSGGGQATGGDSDTPAISADGRYVAFRSSATNLVPGDTNGFADIFVHDRQTGATTRVNVASGGTQATGDRSFSPSISADGRYVAFMSGAGNLVVDDTNRALDAFVHDRVAGTTTRVSVTTLGSQTTGSDVDDSVTLSANGRYVAMSSSATNLVAGDTNNAPDIFVHDRWTGETVRASLGPGESEANNASWTPAFSADGRVLAYSSFGSNLVPGDTNRTLDVFVRATSPVLRLLEPRSGPTTGGTTVRVDGEGFQPGTIATIGGLPALHVDGTSPSRLWATTPANQAGLTDVTVTVPGFDPERLALSYTYVALSGSTTEDTDADGVPDAAEAQYSLDLLDPTDAARDSDGDGVSNAAEHAAGTHPMGNVTRYLAEGAASDFFRTEFALTNPGDSDATVLLRFLPSAGSALGHWLHVPPRSRQTVEAASVPGLGNAEFSTVVESDRPVVVDRMMRWDGTGYGSHMETAMPALSTTWFLAEGATHSGFDLFYLLQNTALTPTTVQVTFMRPAPLPPVVKNYTLEPQSRFNIWVDNEDTSLAATDVSARIVASQPIAVERAMYLSRGNQLFIAGHQSAGVTAPALSWFLAEGATGEFFDLFVLLANPNQTTADVKVTFLRPNGSTIVKTYRVGAQSRFNIWVDHEDPALANTAVSTTVEVTNGVPIVVERAMWWPGDARTWYEAHNSPGVTATGTVWVVASGEDGGPSNAETYVLVANTALIDADVRVTVLFEDGATVTQTYSVPARARLNVPIHSEFPGAAGRRFGVLVESVGLGAASLVVESSIYADAGGAEWQAGANAVATRLR